jgi:hypothetical protein
MILQDFLWGKKIIYFGSLSKKKQKQQQQKPKYNKNKIQISNITIEI